MQPERPIEGCRGRSTVERHFEQQEGAAGSTVVENRGLHQSRWCSRPTREAGTWRV